MSGQNLSGLTARYWQQKRLAHKNAQNALKGAGKKAGPIAMIDMGSVAGGAPGTVKHKHFPAAKLATKNLLKARPLQPSRSGHAMEIAGLVEDWCDADIQHYNVWDDGELDPLALIAALNDVAASGNFTVLNLSIGIDPAGFAGAWAPFIAPITTAIDDCLNAGVVVVAAVGESTPLPGVGPGAPPIPGAAAFPANLPDVISVSAVNAYDTPIPDSNSGALFSAPGEGIDVMIDAEGYRKQDGSSYAAALVSASIWLALAANPALSPKTAGSHVPLLNVLRNSTRPNPPLPAVPTADEALQFAQRGTSGTLDVAMLAIQVPIP